MISIDDIFYDRDVIIESMGFFNPLILEENNVVVTEGIIGGLVEKIKALFRMIKGWLDKLIDFVAEKFNRLGFGKGKNKSDDEITPVYVKVGSNRRKSKSNSIKKANNSKKDDEDEKIDDSEPEDNKPQEPETNKEERKPEQHKPERKQEQDKPKEEKKQHQEQKPHREEKKEEAKKEEPKLLAAPKLINAKNAITALINDCQKAMSMDKPHEYFAKKPPRGYFRKQGMYKLKPEEIVNDPIYKSYNRKAGKDCIDQLRSYQKKLEAVYTQLERTASNIQETDKDRSTQILNRAKSINTMTQKVLGSGVKWLSTYAEEVTKLVSKANKMLKG